jgi:hypothetical protein
MDELARCDECNRLTRTPLRDVLVEEKQGELARMGGADVTLYRRIIRRLCSGCLVAIAFDDARWSADAEEDGLGGA